MIQFLSLEKPSDPKKERLTKDVRYQEFNEVTPDSFRVHAEPVRGHFFFGQERKAGKRTGFPVLTEKVLAPVRVLR